VFAIALTPNGHWWTWAIYGLGVLGYIAQSRHPPTLLKRVAVEFAFVGVVLLVLVRSGGQVIWSWDRYKLQQGLTLGSVTPRRCYHC